MPRLELRLLGGFEAAVGGRAVAFPTRHAALLLARLALDPDRGLARERLAALLWPDRSEEQARTSLRQALYRLRTALAGAEPEPLRVSGAHLSLDGAAVRSDLAELEQADPRDGDALAHALARARGALLEGFETGEPELDGWLLTERARVQGLVMERLRQLAALRGGERRFGEVEGLARRQLALEPYDEAALRALMAALARQGRRNAALAAFRAGADRLRAELGVAPEPETAALWQAIRAGSPEAGPPRPAEEPRPLAPSLPNAPPNPPESEARRQHVAILHLSAIEMAARAGWDPEAAAEAAAALRGRLAGAVAAHGGQVLRSGSGEVVARFGGELSVLSAARAALALLDAGVSAGIHAGDMLADGRDDPGPLGLLARRLAEADAGGVALSDDARLACEGYLVLEPGLPLTLPGAGGPIRTWRATAATGARNSWQARASRGLSPLIGREAELAALRQALARSEAGAVAVLLGGEAGMGKSRLLHELLSLPEARDRRVIEVGAAAWQAEVPHAALGALLRTFAKLGPEAAPGPASEAVARRLDALGAPSSAHAPLRALLGLPVDEGWAARPPGQRRRRTAEALAALLALEAEERPVILAVEDAHWLDPESAEVLDAVAPRLGAAPVLFVVTARPEVRPAWVGQSFARHLRLEGLNAEGTARLLRGVAPGWAADRAARPDLVLRLQARTGGVPLFIEEVAHDMAGSTGAAEEGSPLPASLQALLASRIERLPPDQRRLLQAAAAIGPVIAEPLLRPLAGLSPEALEEALDGLAAAELLYRVRGHPERSYAFKHALTQEAAYRGLLRARRQDLHRRLLALLEERAGDGTPAAVEDLARHARLGTVWDKAALYGTRAGERAMARSAPAAARVHFERALDALGRLPADEDTRRLTVDLRVRLRPALMLTGDYGRVPEVLGAAEAEAASLGDERRLAEVRIHIAFFRATDGSFDQGLEAALRAEAGARRLGDPILLAEATLAKGELLRRRGDYRGAIAALEASLATWTGARRLHRGINIGTRSVFVRGHLAVCRAYLGERTAARAAVDEARTVAEETGRPVDRLFTLLHDGIVTELEGRVAESVPLFEAALGLARTTELPFFADWIIVELGEAMLALGDGRRALALFEAACARPPEEVVPQFDALARAALGKALMMAGRREAAEAVLASVLGYARRVGHRQLEQMALRRTAMAVATRDPSLALGLLDEAVAVAEANGLALGLTKCLEVRTVLLRELGRDGEAASAEARAVGLRQAQGLPEWKGRPEAVG